MTGRTPVRRARRIVCVAAARPNYLKVKPVMDALDNTERPITIEQGTNRLVGRDPRRIAAAAAEVIRGRPPRRVPELWDGRAGERIADVLIVGGERLRPTSLPRRTTPWQGDGEPATMGDR